MGGRGVGRMEWSEGGGWDNYNSIINKYILKIANKICACFLDIDILILK